MDQLKVYSDSRLLGGCTYCGGPEETRDHVPSRVFLDPPFPENLPVVPACWACNNSFSRDEEYLACLVESALAGAAEPDLFVRARVGKILRRSPALQTLIMRSRQEHQSLIHFVPDAQRVLEVALKLARGHAAYELSQLCREQPTVVTCKPLLAMDAQEREAFESPPEREVLGEVGSRGMQRQSVVQAQLIGPNNERIDRIFLIHDWIEVQEGNYRYLATSECDGVRVRFVIREYLACDAVWNDG